jgi:outer membrane immunogenic protein
MKKVAVGVALALALVSNAAADGIDRRYPQSIAAPVPIAPPLTWTGLYVGAGIGGSAVVHDFTLRDVDLGDSRLNGIGDVGVFGTAIVGWDWQVSPTSVLGVFVDYDFHNNSTDFSLLDGLVRTSIDHDHTWSVGARLGVLTSPSTLWYTTGGYTQARFEGTTTLFDDPAFSFSNDRTFNGWFVGGGVDTRLAASNWFLRLEYRFSQFDNERFFSDDELSRVDFEPTVHSVRTTLTYKFSPAAGWNGWGWGR